MPRGCGECHLQTAARWCYGVHEFIPKSYCSSNYKKHQKCPISEIPSLHGDLIDRDKLKEYARNKETAPMWIDFFDLSIADVVIPAEEDD